VQIEPVAFDPDQVAGWPCHQGGVAPKRLAELVNADSERACARITRVAVPQFVDEAIRGYDLVRVHEEDGEKCPLLRSQHLDLVCTVPDLERPQDTELQPRPPFGGRQYTLLPCNPNAVVTMVTLSVRSGSLAFGRFSKCSANRDFERTGAKASLLISASRR
jgi:hypothetical protein